MTGMGPSHYRGTQSGGPSGRKQGGTVEHNRFTPERSGVERFFSFCPDKIQQEAIKMAEENKQYTFENEEYRKTYWHTCSHVLAQAMKQIGRAHV